MNITESNIKFDQPIVLPADEDRDEPKLNTVDSQEDILVKYEQKARRDPELRVKHTTDKNENWYNFRVTDTEHRTCAPRKHFQDVPFPVIRAIYAVGYYVPQIPVSGTIHTKNNIPILLKKLLNIRKNNRQSPLVEKVFGHTEKSFVECSLIITTIDILGKEKFSAIAKEIHKTYDDLCVQCFLEQVAHRTEENLDFIPKQDTWNEHHNDSLPDTDTTTANESDHPQTEEKQEGEHDKDEKEYKVDVTDDIDEYVDDVIGSRISQEWFGKWQGKDNDLLITFVADDKYGHLYLSHQTGDKYVCEHPKLDFIDPLIKKHIENVETDINIENIMSAHNIEKPLDILDQCIGIADYTMENTPECMDYLFEKIKMPMDNALFPAAAISVNRKEYLKANVKAKEIWENKTDNKPIENVRFFDEEYNMFFSLVYKILPEKTEREIKKKIEDETEKRKRFKNIKENAENMLNNTEDMLKDQKDFQ